MGCFLSSCVSFVHHTKWGPQSKSWDCSLATARIHSLGYIYIYISFWNFELSCMQISYEVEVKHWKAPFYPNLYIYICQLFSHLKWSFKMAYQPDFMLSLLSWLSSYVTWDYFSLCLRINYTLYLLGLSPDFFLFFFLKVLSSGCFNTTKAHVTDLAMHCNISWFPLVWSLDLLLTILFDVNAYFLFLHELIALDSSLAYYWAAKPNYLPWIRPIPSPRRLLYIQAD